jgi:hypothetical protein
MTRRSTVAPLVGFLVVLAFGGVARTDPPPPPTAPAADALAQKETTARGKAADEMAALAKSCASYSAYDDARQAYAKAIALNPQNAAFTAELAKLKGKKNAPQKGALAQIGDRRTKSLAKCADLLAPVAAAYAQADRSNDLARLVALMRAQALPAEAALSKLDIVFYEPYLDWRTKKDVERLDAGWEYVDGAWADPKKVAAMNLAHAQWSEPWAIADEVHEVRTTQPLRTARQVLARVGAFRRFFLDYFAGEWDLQTPTVKLPVIVTGTRAELDERARIAVGGMAPIPRQAAAFYLAASGIGNPCFVSFEVSDMTGRITKVDFASLRWPLEHEVAHQIAFEYSKHAAAKGRLTSGQFWAVEGLADFLPNYDLVEGTWTLTHRRRIPMGEGEFETPFAWSHANPGRMPPLDEFVALSHEQFMTVENYHAAATLACYLLEGKERAYRSQFVKLLETVHQAHEDSGTFAACFEGVDVKALDAEYRAFCSAIVLDAK